MWKVEIERKEFLGKCEKKINEKIELLDKCASLVVFSIEVVLFMPT